MRVLILAVNFVKIPYPVYPLGAAVMAETARRRGHEVRLVDLLAESDFSGYDPRSLGRIVDEFRPDCVGLSIRNLETTDSSNADEHWSLDLIKQIVDDLRQISSAPLVLGGAGFSLMPKTVLKHSGADYGLAGEGEEIWPDFLEALAAGRAERGLQARPEPGAAQASAYEPELIKRYADQGGLIGVQTKRGCPLRCLYCSYPLLEGRRVRPRPTEEVLDDLKRLSRLVDHPHIAFADAVFNDPAGHWRELLAAMASAELDLSWTAFFQPAELSAEDCRLIKASGVSGLEFGTDGASDATLKAMHKNFDFGLVERLQRQCLAHEIPAAHYLIFGGPGESPATVEEGIANIEGLEGCVAFISAGLSVYPGTPLAELARREGLIGSDQDWRRPVFYYSPDIDPERLDRRLSEAFGSRRDRLYPPSAAAERTEALRRMGYRGILWDTLIGSGRRSGRAAHV